MNLTSILSWLETRLAERSTWVGLITLAASFGVSISPANAQLIEVVGAAIAGGIMVFSKDKNIDAAIAAALEEFAKNLTDSSSPSKNSVITAPAVEAAVAKTNAK
jgi:hypothetical protein